MVGCAVGWEGDVFVVSVGGSGCFREVGEGGLITRGKILCQLDCLFGCGKFRKNIQIGP